MIIKTATGKQYDVTTCGVSMSGRLVVRLDGSVSDNAQRFTDEETAVLARDFDGTGANVTRYVGYRVETIIRETNGCTVMLNAR